LPQRRPHDEKRPRGWLRDIDAPADGARYTAGSMPAFPKSSSGAEPSSPSLQAAHAARRLAGDEAAGGGTARRDAFAVLLYGLASGFAVHAVPPPPAEALGDRVETLALAMLREVLGQGFREAGRSIDAIAEALVVDPPDAAVLGLLHAGAGAAGAWLAGNLQAFESQVLQATAGDAFVSDRPLLPTR
jgi:hypothetical protein